MEIHSNDDYERRATNIKSEDVSNVYDWNVLLSNMNIRQNIEIIMHSNLKRVCNVTCSNIFSISISSLMIYRQ